ncbi:MAG: ABC transporter substrate-binding protein [Schaalia hyovaginalis]|uniref:ABC transporter substrate-binding protein n=1 Tax=Schaalia hyovaginalis TaxID=29316 RepID=UPI002A91A342|nr:ABC transporter substrate-binding protein [Schaalia hyovaginalis]MDY6213262.1 ABC transporter substrate-binding protein [Schaalia hyovaginalis]
MRTLPAALVLATTASLALAACSDPQTSSTSAESGAGQSASTAVVPFDVSTLEAVDSVVALVPDAVKERGVLRNGASTDYAPGEYLADDGQTPVGYDVDLINAIARVMGLDEGTTQTAGFDTILPQLGSKFDVGASSFTITPERLEAANMVSYIEVGSAYAVAKGNPKGFDPANPCGTTIGVQTGTFQLDYASELSDKCVAEGKEKIEVMPLDLQTDIATKVIGGQYDATLADSTVIGYTIELSGGQLEQVGEVIESAPQGIAMAKDDEQLAKAVQAALQYLMDEGYFEKILAPYGAEGSALNTAELNPAL